MHPKQVTDLPIRVVSRRLVKASDSSIEPHVLAVSNLDLIPNDIQAWVTCIYPKLPTGSGFPAVVAAFSTNLPSFLNHLFFLTGRIAINPTSGLPEVHCYNQGAELIVGEVDLTLGSLDWGMSEESLKKIKLPYADEVVLSVQLLSFTCGGFAVVWANNNLVGDGSFWMMMLRWWSEFVRTGAIAPVGGPNLDRTVFRRPRCPPLYSAAVDEMFVPWDHEHEVNPLTAEASFIERLYYIEARDIARLREEASAEGQPRATSVQAVSAYLWKRLAAVVGSSSRLSDESAEPCRMGWWVDGRWRVTTPELKAALRHYVGNVVTYAHGEAAAEAVVQKPLAEVATMVREAITSIDYDEHYQELVDWMEVHKPRRYVEKAMTGVGTPTVSQTVWASFPSDTDFGFGLPALAMPVSVSGRLCSAYLCVSKRPSDDGSWIISAYIWPRLAAALENDEQRVFMPLTAEFLGLTRGK